MDSLTRHPCPHLPEVLPDHLDRPSCTGVSAASHNLDRPAAEGHVQAGVTVMDSRAGSPAVGTRRDDLQRLCGMKREDEFHHESQS